MLREESSSNLPAEEKRYSLGLLLSNWLNYLTELAPGGQVTNTVYEVTEKKA